MLFWIILAAVAGAGAFIGCGFFAAKTKASKKKEEREIDLWVVLAAIFIVAGGVCSWRSLDTVYKTTIGKAGTPECLDRSTFYRALGTGENLKGAKFVNVQNAADKIITVTSNIQPQRGDFLRVKETSTGKVLEIIEPNSPVSK